MYLIVVWCYIFTFNGFLINQIELSLNQVDIFNFEYLTFINLPCPAAAAASAATSCSTILYDTVFLMDSQKRTGGQLKLLHGFEHKI